MNVADQEVEQHGQTVLARRIALLVFVGMASTLCVFALPWMVPMRQYAVDSYSQAVGFSNRFAAVSAIIGAVGLAVVAYLTRTSPGKPFVVASQPAEDARLGRMTVALVAGGSAIVVLGMAVFLAGRTMLDSEYLVDRMLYVVNGSLPYSQFEFSYGPLLLYPQAWLFMAVRNLGVSANWVYWAWLAVAQAGGVVLCAYVIDRLAIPSRRVRLWLLVALALVDAPLFTLNDSLVRFVLPYALLLAVLGFARREGFTPVAAAWALSSAVLSALVSPEQGVALLAGMVAAFAIPAWRGEQSSRAALGVLLVGGAVIAWVVSHLPMLAWTSAGVNNLPVLVRAPQVTLLAALFVVAIGIGSELQPADTQSTAALVGWFTVGLMLLFSAYGRADGMHVFLNGIGLLLAAAAILSRRRFVSVWIAAGAVAFAVTTYGWTASAVNTVMTGRHMSDGTAEIRALSKVAHLAVAAPLPDRLGADLALRHALVPTYGWHMYDAREPALVLSQVSAVPYVLVSTSIYVRYAGVAPRDGGCCLYTPRSTRDAGWQRLWYGLAPTVAPRYASLDSPGSLYPLILSKYGFDRRVGDYTLLRRR